MSLDISETLRSAQKVILWSNYYFQCSQEKSSRNIYFLMSFCTTLWSFLFCKIQIVHLRRKYLEIENNKIALTITNQKVFRYKWPYFCNFATSWTQNCHVKNGNFDGMVHLEIQTKWPIQNISFWPHLSTLSRQDLYYFMCPNNRGNLGKKWKTPEGRNINFPSV